VQIKIDQLKLIIEQVNYLISKMQVLTDWPKGRDNGYCTIMSATDSRVLLAFQVGNCPSEKVQKYHSLSNEKALRLRSFSIEGHVSSWQSRDECAGHWGGAILAGNVIFSFSGLPEELADEAVMLIAAVWCGFMTAGQAIATAKISGNSYFTQLNDLLGQ
jgi:hypothetical protein